MKRARNKSSSPAIRTHNLVKTFNGEKAVDGINLQVERGTFFGFLGPNGAGKTTTINILTGLTDSISGGAEVLGWDTAQNPVEIKKRIGVVPEEFMLFEKLTAPEYLSFTGNMYGMNRDEIKSRSIELLETLALDEHRNKLIAEFSHGMKKKLSLASALIHRPELLILDEPFEGIDPVSSRTIKRILENLVKRDVTVFLTSHILEIIEKLCVEVAVIHKGKIAVCDSLENLSSRNGGPDDGLENIFMNLAGERETRISWLED